METRTKIIVSICILAVFGGGVFVYQLITSKEPAQPEAPEQEIPEAADEPSVSKQVIGTSVEGRDIEAVTFGDGDKHLLFVGGVHGGYEWNSVLLAYEFIDYFTENPDEVSEVLTISIIPSANPDGVYDVIGMEGRFTLADVPADEGAVGNGRFNAHGVDLNRNFDCKWEPESTWRGETVSAGTAPFSEPEAAALRNFVLRNEPEAVVFWHSQAAAVYASECHGGVLPETMEVMNTYADAAGYRSVESFDAYPITGDAEGWLASIGIPSVTVELATHETLEWEQNLAGTKALLEYMSGDRGVAR